MEPLFDEREAGSLGQAECLAGHPGLAIMQNPSDGRHCVEPRSIDGKDMCSFTKTTRERQADETSAQQNCAHAERCL